jgi:Kef-type K+ transport system membrane component KefB
MNAPLYVSMILLLGLLGGKICTKAKLPSVTGFIIAGMILGPSFINILTEETIKSMSFVNEFALGILAISLGAELHWKTLKKYGNDLIALATGDILLTIVLVSGLSYILGLSIEISLILGVLAITVSPSGIVPVIKEYGGKGEVTQNILAMVAIDNLLGILLFGIMAAIFETFAGTVGTSIVNIFAMVFMELGGAVLLGAFSGYVIVYFIKKKTNNSQFLVILIAIILLNTGLATVFHFSALLVNIVSGIVVTNLRNRSMTLPATIDRIQLPITVMYLTLAGARIDLSVVASLAAFGGVYILGRFSGKVLGCYLFSRITKMSEKISKNVGMGLTPQAGITVGLSIIAEQKIPESKGIITGVVLTGVVFFQIIGPLLVAKALKNAGEATNHSK